MLWYHKGVKSSIDKGIQLSFYHDSQQRVYRSPFGAVPCGERMTLSIDAMGEPDTQIVLRRHSEANGTEMLQGRSIPIPGGDRWRFELTAPVNPGLFWYDFEIHTQGQVRWYAAPDDGLGGEGILSFYAGKAWQVTVYQPAEDPVWPSQGIMYQIYVDRFYNGYADKHIEHAPEGALIHAHWEDTPFYTRDEQNAVVRWDFFGGNLRGVEEKLDYLQQMGVTILYLNPIFLSGSNHKYDTSDYRRIDPMYGGEDAFASLMQSVQARGMRLILDGVFSHTGSDSIYFNRQGRYGGLGAYQSQQSPYFSWYRFSHWPDQYDCWWGVETMPNVNELDPGYLAYQLHDPDSTVRKWMGYGIDGFRLDVADELPDAFIAQLKDIIRQEKSDSFLLGEVWEDASNKVSYDVRRQYFMGRELDSVTNYPLRNALLELILGRRSPAAMVRLMKSLQENYPRAQFNNLMNMTGTHDTPRLMTLLGEAPDPGTLTELERAQYQLPSDRRAMGQKRVALYAAVLFTHPGIPTVYYGDEAGMEGYADPYNRGPYPWGREDGEVQATFRRLSRLRRDEPLLSSGSYSPFALEGGLYGHWRWQKNEGVLTVINPEKAECSSLLPLSGYPVPEALWQVAGSNSWLQPEKAGFRLHLAGWDYLIAKVRAAQ